MRVAKRAGCAPENAPVARRETRELRAGRRAGCVPGTRELRAGRHAGCTPKDVPVCTPENVPENVSVVRRETCRRRAVCAPGAHRMRALAGPAVRSGLSLLARVSQSSAVGPRAGGGTPGVDSTRFPNDALDKADALEVTVASAECADCGGLSYSLRGDDLQSFCS